MLDLNRQNNFRQLLLQAVKDGFVLPAYLNNTPAEVILETPAGAIRFCIAERRLVMARSEDGLALRITPRPSLMSPAPSVAVEDGLGSHDVEFGPCRARITALRGTIRRCPGGLEIAPDGQGVTEVAIADFLADPLPRKREDYPDYAESAA